MPPVSDTRSRGRPYFAAKVVAAADFKLASVMLVPLAAGRLPLLFAVCITQQLLQYLLQLDAWQLATGFDLPPFAGLRQLAHEFVPWRWSLRSDLQLMAVSTASGIDYTQVPYLEAHDGDSDDDRGVTPPSRPPQANGEATVQASEAPSANSQRAASGVSPSARDGGSRSVFQTVGEASACRFSRPQITPLGFCRRACIFWVTSCSG